MQQIHGTDSENQIRGINKEGNFHVMPSGQLTNITEDYMYILCWIGIKIDDNKDPAIENIFGKQWKQQGNGQEVDEVWKSEDIICPWKENNV